MWHRVINNAPLARRVVWYYSYDVLYSVQRAWYHSVDPPGANELISRPIWDLVACLCACPRPSTCIQYLAPPGPPGPPQALATADTRNDRGLRCSSGGGHIAHWPVAQTDGGRRAAPQVLLPWLVATGNWQNWAHVVHVPTIARAVWSPHIPLSEKFLSAPIDPLLPPKPPLAVLVPGREARPPAP